MSAVDYLREFISERLTAAAEEIFGVFKKTIVEYEEEMDRQRKLQDVVRKPVAQSVRMELPQQHFCKEEEVMADQQPCKKERNSSLQLPQIKEEQEELCTSQEGEMLELKVETDTIMLTPFHEESVHQGEETQYFDPDKSQSEAETEPPASVYISWLKSESDSNEVSEPKSGHQLSPHNSHVAESQDQTGVEHGDSDSSKTSNVRNADKSESHCNTYTGKRSFKCNTCGKVCRCLSKLNIHMRIHTGEKPYSCNTCGKRFSQTSGLKAHRRIHTGERPYSCNTCGKTFNQTSVLNAHIRIHTGERPYSCETCGKAFRYSGDLTVHIRRAHTTDKPYNCNKCGNKDSLE